VGGSADTGIRESNKDFLIVLLSIMRIDMLLRLSMLNSNFKLLSSTLTFLFAKTLVSKRPSSYRDLKGLKKLWKIANNPTSLQNIISTVNHGMSFVVLKSISELT